MLKPKLKGAAALEKSQKMKEKAMPKPKFKLKEAAALKKSQL